MPKGTDDAIFMPIHYLAAQAGRRFPRAAIRSCRCIRTIKYGVDCTSALRNVIMEQEGGSGALTYQYFYGVDKLSITIHGILNGVGNVARYLGA